MCQPGAPVSSRAVNVYLIQERVRGGPNSTDTLTRRVVGKAWPTGTIIVGPGILFSYARVTNEVDPLDQVNGWTLRLVLKKVPIRVNVVEQLRGSFAPKTKGSAQDPRIELKAGYLSMK